MMMATQTTDEFNLGWATEVWFTMWIETHGGRAPETPEQRDRFLAEYESWETPPSWAPTRVPGTRLLEIAPAFLRKRAQRIAQMKAHQAAIASRAAAATRTVSQQQQLSEAPQAAPLQQYQQQQQQQQQIIQQRINKRPRTETPQAPAIPPAGAFAMCSGFTAPQDEIWMIQQCSDLCLAAACSDNDVSALASLLSVSEGQDADAARAAWCTRCIQYCSRFGATRYTPGDRSSLALFATQCALCVRRFVTWLREWEKRAGELAQGVRQLYTRVEEQEAQMQRARAELCAAAQRETQLREACAQLQRRNQMLEQLARELATAATTAASAGAPATAVLPPAPGNAK